MGHKFSFCKTCETPLDCDCCGKLEMLEEETHGSWEMIGRWWKCSECGIVMPGAQTTQPSPPQYCPWCGAKMDKEDQK